MSNANKKKVNYTKRFVKLIIAILGDPISIPFSQIKLSLPKHQDSKQLPKCVLNSTNLAQIPIIVHSCNHDKYSLLFNWRTYKIYEHLAKTDPNIQVPCVVVRSSYPTEVLYETICREYENFLLTSRIETLISIGSIHIQKAFEKTVPHRSKIDKAIAHYEKYEAMDKPIVIDRNRMLVDGYARYLAAIELGLDDVVCEMKY